MRRRQERRSMKYNIEQVIENEFSGLDLRILSLSIGLGLSFLGRALFDGLYANDIMSLQFESPIIDLAPIIITELTPTLIVARIMRKRSNPA